jgi:3-oxoacyl-[acyl-carrier-protein] synthase II
MLACHVTIIHGAEGPSNTITCAEASGLLSIGESTRVIERGSADVCFSGGAESKVNLMGLLRLELAGFAGPTGDERDGSRLVRPYDARRESIGLVGEGGGILMLEELEHARRRAAPKYAEVIGFGGGHSGLDYTKPAGAEGYRYAIENALDDAGVRPGDISAIVPLGLGVPDVDTAELAALRQVFGDRLASIPLVTLTPALGNAPAGTSALQAAVAALCLRHQRLPARLHAGRLPDGVDLAPAPARSRPLQCVLACAGSLGGQNAAIVCRAVSD